MIDTPSAIGYRIGWTYPAVLLRAAFGFGLLLVAGIVILAPWAVPFVPIVLVGGIVGWKLIRSERWGLVVVIGSFVTVASFDEGIGPDEVLYALFYTGYLAQWFFRRLFLSREPLLKSTVDFLFVIFLLMVSVYCVIGRIFGAEFSAILAEFQSMTLLLFYFPVKEAVTKSDWKLKWLIIVLTAMGLFVVARNSWELAERLSTVTQTWQVTIKGRVVTNEMLMLVPAFLMLSLALMDERFKRRLTYFILFLAMFFGLVITQGRGYWLGLAFGLGILFLALDGRTRSAMLLWGFLGLAGVVAGIFIFFGEYALLLGAGLVNRVISIATATTKDISLIGRFIEWQSVLKDIAVNPIMGYGPGVEISYYDITRSVTMIRPWIHNGYLALIFKYGILGLGTMLAIMLLPIKHALSIVGRRTAPKIDRAASLAAVGTLSAILISTIPSNAWHNSDTLLMIAVVVGVAEGCFAKVRK